jgi:hypothetical protein
MNLRLGLQRKLFVGTGLALDRHIDGLDGSLRSFFSPFRRRFLRIYRIVGRRGFRRNRNLSACIRDGRGL